MAKRLIVSRRALHHIDRIVDFNNHKNYSNRYSRKFVKGIYKIFNLLSKHPFLGRNTDEEDVYVLIWDKFYIFYIIIDEDLIINSIFHQAENIM